MKTKTTKQHEQEYYHIPKGRLRFTLITLGLILLTIFFIFITIDSWKFLKLGNLECSKEFCNYYSYQLLIIPLLFLDCILIGLFVLNFVSIFKKLKDYNEDGLIDVLIYGLIIGLIIGLINGLIIGLIVGLFCGLICELG